MKALLQVTNVVVAWLSAGAGLLAMLFLPDAWAQRISEPEDLLVLGAWLAVMVGFALTAWLSHVRLSRARGDGARPAWLSNLNLAAVAMCVVGIVLGAVSNQPSSVDLYFLVLPAVLFGLNAYVLRRAR